MKTTTPMKLISVALLLGFASTASAQIDEPKKETTVENAAGDDVEPAADPSTHFNYTNIHYSGKDEYGDVFGDGKEKLPNGHVVHEEEPMSPPFIFMLINFGILLIILGKYGAPAARKIAQTRHDTIKDALDEAAKLRDEAAAKLAEFEARIKDVDAEINAIVVGIRADAEADKQRILAAAEQQAAAMKRDAEQRIAAEIDTARAMLTKEVTAAAIAATEQIIKDKATADDQRKLVSAFITNVAVAQPETQGAKQ